MHAAIDRGVTNRHRVNQKSVDTMVKILSALQFRCQQRCVFRSTVLTSAHVVLQFNCTRQCHRSVLWVSKTQSPISLYGLMVFSIFTSSIPAVAAPFASNNRINRYPRCNLSNRMQAQAAKWSLYSSSSWILNLKPSVSEST